MTDATSKVPTTKPPQTPIGRIPVLAVTPSVDGGLRPACCVLDEPVTIAATVFREGHDAVNATAVVTDPAGKVHALPMDCVNPGLDSWEASLAPTILGLWSFSVEGWSDPYGTWVHDATIKVEADIDTELMLEEGARVLERAATEVKRPAAGAKVLKAAIRALRDTGSGPMARLAAGVGEPVAAELRARPLRDWVTVSPTYSLLVERKRALYGAWYEIFPRSEGATYNAKTHTWKSGTLRTAAKRLPAIAAMGFDVVYLTPINPIGTTARKGPNNTLTAQPGDPGSPYAIGSPDGGHDAIHPDLGTFKDFDAFMRAAKKSGLEVAMDLALQASPDHPWVTEHPEYFTTRADGTIAYAENPPKKYQDIYPVNFDNDPAGAYAEVRRVVQVWLEHGVRIFRVDNPHTKPVEFWQWLIADVATDYPDVIWLAEAFTKPAMMHTLAKVGFQQSYTYYAWRETKAELTEYLTELIGEASYYMRPSFWPTTHDILTPYMQFGGEAAWKLRAAIAATAVPTYGIYAGYELMESVARPGAQEQIDNEKYEYKDRHWSRYAPGGDLEGASLIGWLTMLNALRREHPSLHLLRNLTFHHVHDPGVIAYSKRASNADGTDDVVIVVANLDPHTTRETLVNFDLGALGLPEGSTFTAHDHANGATYEWGAEAYVRLGPDTQPVHLVTLGSGRGAGSDG